MRNARALLVGGLAAALILGIGGTVLGQVPVPRGPRVISAPPAPARTPTQAATPRRTVPAPRAYVGGNANPAGLGGTTFFMPTGIPAAPVVDAPVDNQRPTYSSGYYGLYGLPNTYYLPTYQSYVGYAAPGSVTAAPGYYPVPSVTYSTPGSPSLFQGSASGASSSLYSNAGYVGYANPTAYYGAPNMTSVTIPGYVTYGQNSHAALTPPGYYGNYVVTQPTTSP